jgi:4'-phosphopantetheinyl transferase EntD
MIGLESTIEYGGPREQMVSELARETPASWLSPVELDWVRGLPNERRRDDWLGGRWCVKRLVLRLASLGLQPGIGRELEPLDITVQSVNARGRSTRPTVYIAGVASAFAVSIAHSDQQVFATAAIRPRIRVGIDVVDGAGRWDALAAAWFTPCERALVGRNTDPLDMLRVWSAKEACYKAIVSPQPFDPRSIEIDMRSMSEGEARIASDAFARAGSRTAAIRWRRTPEGLRAVAFSQEFPP